jgi:replication factor A1
VAVEKVEASELPDAAEGGIDYKVADLQDGLRNVTVVGRILTVEAKEVTVKDEAKTVWSGTLGDGTGKVQFSAWKDFGLKQDQLVKITGAYVRGWRGTPQLTFDDRCEVEAVDDASFPSLKEIRDSGPVPIGRFVGGSGQVDVTVEGAVLEVRPGSGLIARCGECNRALQNGECSLHGATTGTPDLRVKAVLDDGSGALNLLLGRPLTEEVLGKDLAACQKLAADGGTGEVVVTELRSKLVGRTFRVRGNVLTDDFGPMLIAQEVHAVQRDLKAAAEALLAEIEGVA